MRVLIIEDDRLFSQALKLNLSGSGANITLAHSAEDAFELASIYDFDVLLLDLGLPDEHGRSLLKRLRARKVQTPVIVISGTSDLSMKVEALSVGADDYVTKPFQKEELIARMAAVVRRAAGHSQSTLQMGPLTLGLDSRRVTVHGRPLHLTPKEYQLLELLALRKGSTMTKEMVLNHLYNGLDEPSAKIVDVFVCKLRKKLAAAGAGDLVQTVWGRGYMVCEPSSQPDMAA
ncbi:MAG TPA: response regulator transcription factor [Caulobacteraceae bacterium]